MISLNYSLDLILDLNMNRFGVELNAEKKRELNFSSTKDNCFLLMESVLFYFRE